MAQGQAVLELGDGGVVVGQLLPDRQRPLVRPQRLLLRADLVRDRADPGVGVGQVRLQLRVVPMTGDEPGVVLQRPFQELFTQRPQVGPVLTLQERVLANPGQVVLHRLAGRLEIRLRLRLRRTLGCKRPHQLQVLGIQLVVLGIQLVVLARDHRHEAREADQAERQHGRRAGHQRAVAPHPPPRPDRKRLAPGRDRLVGHPPLDVLRQHAPAKREYRSPGRCAIAFEADRLQRQVDGSASWATAAGENSPRCTARSTSPMSPSTGGRPASR